MKMQKPEWKTYDTFFALDSFGAYWLENERLIQREAEAEQTRSGPKWIPRTDEEYGEFREYQRIARELYDEIMMPIFRYSCVVMLYAVFERELSRLLDNIEE